MKKIDLTKLSLEQTLKNMKVYKHGYHVFEGFDKPLKFICNYCGKDQTKDECNCA